MTGLEQILADEPTETTVEPEAKEAAAPAPEEAKGAPETPAEDPTGEKPADQPKDDAPPASKEPQHVPIDALIEERRKRQEFERQLEELRNQQKPKERPDWHNEPDKAASTLEQQFETRLLNERFNMSETLARQQYGAETIDKDVEAFEAMVKERPYLREELRNAPHPYDFVHQTVQKETMLKEMGDPETFKQKLLADPEFLKLAAEKAGALQPAAPPKPAKPGAPPSLAGETSEAAAKGPPIHRSLDEIINS